MKKAAAVPPPYPIESVDNALRLLVLFRDRPYVRVSEASDMLGVARSTAHRLLAMLQYHGFVAQDPEMRVYRPGPMLLEVGLGAVRDMDIRRVGLVPLERLNRSVNETVHLAVQDGDHVHFVAGFESTLALRAGDRTGWRLPMHVTASGKAILSQMDEAEIREILPKRLPPVTASSLTRWSDLEEQLEAVRTRGFATNFGESEDGLVAVAAPVVDRMQRVRAAVVVTGPSARADEEWVRRIAPPTMATATDIGAALG
jgi:DNA-binding IclR family transcriptional regulator